MAAMMACYFAALRADCWVLKMAGQKAESKVGNSADDLVAMMVD